MQDRGRANACSHTRTANRNGSTNSRATCNLTALVHTYSHTNRADACTYSGAHAPASNAHANRYRADGNANSNACRCGAPRHRQASRQNQNKPLHGRIVRSLLLPCK